MSLSLVTGTDVPETANGVVTPVPAENGTVICGGSRVPCSGDTSPHGTLIDTDCHSHTENKVPDGDGFSATYNNVRTSSLTGASLPSRDPDLPEDSDTSGTPDAAPPGDPVHCQGFGRLGDPASVYGEETVDADSRDLEEEEEEGEKEKQDEEGDEKNEKKWIHQRSGGRAEVKVSELNYFRLYCIKSGPG